MSDAKRDDPPREPVAVRLPTQSQLIDILEKYLATRGWTAAERFLPKDDDELNDRLCRGEFAAVVFAVPEDAMRMIWSGHGSVGRWHAGENAAKVEICFASGDVGGEVDWPEHLRRIERSFAEWESGRRRRQVIAGSILTAVALVAMAVLLWTRG